jgi:hypothetical protein
MPNSARVEKNSIIKILVGGVTVAESFASMQEKRHGKVVGGTLGPEVQEFRSEIMQWTAVIFRANKVIAGNNFGIEPFGLDAKSYI